MRKPSDLATGRHLRPGAVETEHLAAAAHIIVGQQRLDRHVHESRVAVIAFAIGEGELDRLHDRMRIVERVVTHGLEIDALQHTEHLQQHRALAPGPAGVHVGAGEARLYRRLTATRNSAMS